MPGGPVEQMVRMLEGDHSSFGELTRELQLQALQRELRSVRARAVMFTGEQADSMKIVWRRLKSFMDLTNLRTRDLLK